MSLSLDIIRESINERKHLQFDYRGLLRIVEPMALGVGHKGDWQLRAQQIGGLSSSGKVDEGSPKLFDVALMSAVTVLDVGFDVTPLYRSRDQAFAHIDTEL